MKLPIELFNLVDYLNYDHELMGLVCFPSVDARVPFISIIVGTLHLLGRFRHNAYFVVKTIDWIVSVQWYEFVPTKTNRRGDRFYKKALPNGFIVDQ